MTREEAIGILRKHNEWRRYDGEVGKGPEMIDPKTLGEAIDTAIQELERAKETIELAEDHAMLAGRVQMKEEMMKCGKSGVVCDDDFIKFDDGAYLDFQDPTMQLNPAFKLPKNGTRVRLIMIEEE